MGETRHPLGEIPLILAGVHLVLAVAGAIGGNWARAGIQFLLTILWGGWYFWFSRRDLGADPSGHPGPGGAG